MPTDLETRFEEDRQLTLNANRRGVLRDFAQEFPDKNAFTQLVATYFQLFPQDQTKARDFFGLLSKEQLRKEKIYLDLLQALFQDVVAFGFPKFMGNFTTTHQEKALRNTGRPILHLVNILALRAYLADINLQALALKQQYLQQQLALSLAGMNIEQLERRVAGTMLTVQDGTVVNTGHLEQTSIGIQQRAKFPGDMAWFPDEKQAQAMLAIGRSLGRKNGSSRDETYKVLGSLSNERFSAIFPNVQESSEPVSSEHQVLIETAFRGSGPNAITFRYEQLRNLFATVN